MVLLTKFPPDIRVEKELRTLLTEHEIFLLCPRRGGCQDQEMWNGLNVQRVFSPLARWWNNFCLMTRCFSRGWQQEIGSYIARNQLDALHVHDLPLLGPALRAAQPFKIPVVADLHENYPAMMEESLKVPLARCSSLGQFTVRLLASAERWKSFERKMLPRASAVITVIEEARERLVREGVRFNSIHVVANYNQFEAADVSQGLPERVGKEDKAFRVVYAGGFDVTRDLVTVVDAAALCRKRGMARLEVILVGGVGGELEQMRGYAESKIGDGQVKVLGWIPREEAEELMDSASVGLVPHVKSAHTDATVPHKLFQYMGRRLPVVVSNCAPLERIVSTSKCGMVYKSGDSQELSDCLWEIYRSPEKARKMGEAGKIAVAERYNWGKAGAVLLKLYQQLFGRA